MTQGEITRTVTPLEKDYNVTAKEEGPGEAVTIVLAPKLHDYGFRLTLSPNDNEMVLKSILSESFGIKRWNVSNRNGRVFVDGVLTSYRTDSEEVRQDMLEKIKAVKPEFQDIAIRMSRIRHASPNIIR